jgi:transposase
MSDVRLNGAAGDSLADGAQAEAPVDPQVIPGASEFGNRYTRVYKLKVLRESDGCTKPGEMGQYLRRMGITHSTLTSFRRQRAAGTLDSPEPSPRPRKNASGKSPDKNVLQDARRLMALERENRKLKRQLAQAEMIIDLQKKLSELLGISLDDAQGAPGSKETDS